MTSVPYLIPSTAIHLRERTCKVLIGTSEDLDKFSNSSMISLPTELQQHCLLALPDKTRYTPKSRHLHFLFSLLGIFISSNISMTHSSMFLHLFFCPISPSNFDLSNLNYLNLQFSLTSVFLIPFPYVQLFLPQSITPSDSLCTLKKLFIVTLLLPNLNFMKVKIFIRFVLILSTRFKNIEQHGIVLKTFAERMTTAVLSTSSKDVLSEL